MDKKSIYMPPVAEIQIFRTEELFADSPDDALDDGFENW